MCRPQVLLNALYSNHTCILHSVLVDQLFPVVSFKKWCVTLRKGNLWGVSLFAEKENVCTWPKCTSILERFVTLYVFSRVSGGGLLHVPQGTGETTEHRQPRLVGEENKKRAGGARWVFVGIYFNGLTLMLMRLSRNRDVMKGLQILPVDKLYALPNLNSYKYLFRKKLSWWWNKYLKTIWEKNGMYGIDLKLVL